MDSKIVCYAQEKNLIISEDCLRLLNQSNYQRVLDKLAMEKKVFVCRDDIKKILATTNWLSEQDKPSGNAEKNFRIMDAYDVTGKTLSQGSVEDFLSLFLDKYSAIYDILKRRENLKPIPIDEAKKQGKNTEVDIVGMVLEKRVTKQGNILITVDDPTGRVNVVVTEGKDYEANPRDVLLDNVIGIKCSVLSRELFIAKDIMFADLPYEKLVTTAENDCYAALIGDLHVGSKLFREEEFNDFLEWLNGMNASQEDLEIISKIKYLIIAGDLVDGIGIYPKQYNELAITDIFEQYRCFEELALKIPDNIEVFLIPGNHDAVRLSEPQPAIAEKFLPNIYKKKNMHVLGSPSWVEIEGLLFLLYHGATLHGIFGKINDLKMDKPDLAQKELLIRRDLMPEFGGKQTFVPIERNFMVIREAPAVFVCGHIHHHAYSRYKQCHLISTSCWQSLTAYQEELGHTPTVSKAILFNLKDQSLHIKDFERKNE